MKVFLCGYEDRFFILDWRACKCDEIWNYVGKKQKHLTAQDDKSRVAALPAIVRSLGRPS